MVILNLQYLSFVYGSISSSQGFGGNSGGPNNNQPGSSQQGGNFLNWMNQGGAGGGSGVNDGGQQVQVPEELPLNAHLLHKPS